MVVAKYKGPIQAQPPIAVFADLPTLCSAPTEMIAAGLGDLLGKYTSLADWQLGALLYNEPFDENTYMLMRESADETVAFIDELSSRSCDGITSLINGLVKSGFGMLTFGESRPASGSEHHIAHFWEMKYILENRPAILHGAKVGIATIISACRYDLLRKMTRDEAAACLNDLPLPKQEEILAQIQVGYGPVTERIISIQQPLLDMSDEDLSSLKDRILNNWAEIQTIAHTVPHPADIAKWIVAVGGPTKPHEIGLTHDDVTLGIRSAHFLRDRFTLNRLAYWLNLPLGTE